MLLPATRLLIVIADRCPWHVLLIDRMSVKLREQGIACGVIGLVEQGILDAANIAGLRRLADKTGGAWDLANGRELADAVKTLGLHLFRKLGTAVTVCEIAVLDHGHLMMFRDCVETGVKRLSEELAREGRMTDLFFYWRSQPALRLGRSSTTPTIHPWSPPLFKATFPPCPADKLVRQLTDDQSPPLQTADLRQRDRSTNRPQKTCQSPHTDRSTPSSTSGSAVDRIIQWGLWLSGGALLSALTLLAKK